MRQIGHRKSSFTLEVYTDVKSRRDAANDRLGALLRSPEVAQSGANGASAPLAATKRLAGEALDPALHSGS